MSKCVLFGFVVVLHFQTKISHGSLERMSFCIHTLLQHHYCCHFLVAAWKYIAMISLGMQVYIERVL